MKTSRTEQQGSNRLLFVHGDPVGTLLMERLGMRYWAAAIVVLVVLGVPIYTIVTLRGHWLGETGILKDYIWWWAQFVSSPAPLVFLFWMPQGIRSILDGLRSNGVILISERQEGDADAYMEFLEDLDRSLSNPVWPVACLAFAGLWTFVPNRMWWSQTANWRGGAAMPPDYLAFWANLLYFMVIGYFWFFLAVKGTLVVIWLNRLFRKFKIHVKGLDADRVGGFSPFGTFIQKVGLLFAIAGATLWMIVLDALSFQGRSLQEILLDPMLDILSVAFVVAAITVFFIIMRGAHLAMRRYRDHQLQQISEKFESGYAAAQTGPISDPDSQDDLERLEQIAQLHSVVSRFPVWPVDTRGVAQFFTLILAPLIAAIIFALLEPLVR